MLFSSLNYFGRVAAYVQLLRTAVTLNFPAGMQKVCDIAGSSVCMLVGISCCQCPECRLLAELVIHHALQEQSLWAGVGRCRDGQFRKTTIQSSVRPSFQAKHQPSPINSKVTTKPVQIPLDRPCARFWFRLRIHLVFLTLH